MSDSLPPSSSTTKTTATMYPSFFNKNTDGIILRGRRTAASTTMSPSTIATFSQSNNNGHCSNSNNTIETVINGYHHHHHHNPATTTANQHQDTNFKNGHTNVDENNNIVTLFPHVRQHHQHEQPEQKYHRRRKKMMIVTRWYHQCRNGSTTNNNSDCLDVVSKVLVTAVLATGIALVLLIIVLVVMIPPTPSSRTLLSSKWIRFASKNMPLIRYFTSNSHYFYNNNTNNNIRPQQQKFTSSGWKSNNRFITDRWQEQDIAQKQAEKEQRALKQLPIQISFCQTQRQPTNDTATTDNKEEEDENDDTTNNNSNNATFVSSLFTLDDYCTRSHIHPYDYIDSLDVVERIKRQYNYTTAMTKVRNAGAADSSSIGSSTSTNNNNNKHPLPILIVGGTDGSGTRAFVDILRQQLGTWMLIEDKQTMDIHAAALFHKAGWPRLANYIFNLTHTANYQFDDTDIPRNDQRIIQQELMKFHRSYMGKYLRDIKYIDKVQLDPTSFDGTTNTTKYQRASPHTARGLLFGFKAPIAMVLLPLFRQLYGTIKFIHVVRDGRDVALSTNMSPVAKFYETFYGSNVTNERKQIAKKIIQENNETIQKQPQAQTVQTGTTKGTIPKATIDYQNILAMDLWNDWNLQVHDYCKQVVAEEEVDPTNDFKSFDYIVVRAEDLMSSPQTKYATLTKIAAFVGTPAPMTNEHLCTYSIDETSVKDMGNSDSMYSGPNVNDKPCTTGIHCPRHPRYRGRPPPNHARSFPTGEGVERGGSNYNDRQFRLPQRYHNNDRRQLTEVVPSSSSFVSDFMGRLDPHHYYENKFGSFWSSSSSTSYQYYDSTTARSTHGIGTDTRPLVTRAKDNAAKQKQQLQQRPLYSSSSRYFGRNRNKIGSDVPLKNRYGKWMKILNEQPILSQALHQRGSEALRIFGYEPYRTIDSDLYHSSTYTICPPPVLQEEHEPNESTEKQ